MRPDSPPCFRAVRKKNASLPQADRGRKTPPSNKMHPVYSPVSSPLSRTFFRRNLLSGDCVARKTSPFRRRPTTYIWKKRLTRGGLSLSIFPARSIVSTFFESASSSRTRGGLDLSVVVVQVALCEACALPQCCSRQGLHLFCPPPGVFLADSPAPRLRTCRGCLLCPMLSFRSYLREKSVGGWNFGNRHSFPERLFVE